MTSDENIAAIEAAYKVADHDLRVRYSKIGCVLALVLVPVFWGLDWTVYRDYVWSMLNARLLCDAGIAIVLVLLFTRVGRRNIRVLGIMWAIFPGIAIAWMIYATEGAMSPYYAGLNLVMIIVCLLMPWTAAEVIALCALTVSMYLGACIGHQVRVKRRSISLSHPDQQHVFHHRDRADLCDGQCLDGASSFRGFSSAPRTRRAQPGTGGDGPSQV